MFLDCSRFRNAVYTYLVKYNCWSRVADQDAAGVLPCVLTRETCPATVHVKVIYRHGKPFRLLAELILLGLVGLGIGLSVIETARGQSDAEPPAASPEYSRDGADSCLRCHDEDEAFPVLDIFKTRHGHRGNPEAPFGQLQCESCHGAAGEHAGRVRRNEARPPIRYFGANATATVAQENEVCQGCHRSGHSADWDGSIHAESELGCTSCHQVHVLDDAVLDRGTEAGVCFQCHLKQRSDSLKFSGHPLREGKMACSDCHQPHDAGHAEGTAGQNTACYACHADKRGPFLWEHPPVEEDCGLCHNPHGSNHPALLNRSGTLLCQQCHSRSGHPELALTGDQLPGRGGTQSALLLARGCANCHSQVHGSNHPSGVNLTR